MDAEHPYLDTIEGILFPLDCARALTVMILARHGQWNDIANLGIDPLHYTDADSFRRAYQATKLLSKAEWLPTGIDRRKVAVEKFRDAETQCRLTNEFWSAYRSGRLKIHPNYERIFVSARRKIGLVLGSQLYKWTEFCNFGPGADLTTKQGMTSAYNKLSQPGSITSGALPYMEAFCELTRLGQLFTWDIRTRRLAIEITRGNRVTFVPKNAKTFRSIAVEPRWNIFMQKGLGRYLRYRLRQFGVDLDHQEINQNRAMVGSRTGKYATIDLASASDTISSEVVRELLPLPWLTIFESLRSPAYLLDGEWHDYQKWSSMGNGYTFELESLLFWALCSSVHEDVSIYGDDLVVPTESFETIRAVLGIAGFSLNPEKSFYQGPFRESCGFDTFLGEKVTPIYWKDQLSELGTLRLVNQISVLASRCVTVVPQMVPDWDPIGCKIYWRPSPATKCLYRDAKWKPVWSRLARSLPRRFQVRGPTFLSSVIHDSSSSWRCTRRAGWSGYFVRLWLPIPRRFRFHMFEAALISQYFQPSTDGYVVRERYTWKKQTVFIPQGYEDLGPWIG